MTRAHLILIALLSLLVGALVYVTRPAGALFLVPFGDLSGVSSGALSFGPLGGSLPSLTHALSFTLLSAVALGATRRAAFVSAALWLSTEVAFEVGQHPVVAARLDALGLGSDLFRYGTFDPLDLAACAFGVAAAVLMLSVRSSGVRRA